MPKYSFRISSGGRSIEDAREAVDLPDPSAGTREQQAQATSRIAEHALMHAHRHGIGFGPKDAPGRVLVMNQSDQFVLVLNFPKPRTNETRAEFAEARASPRPQITCSFCGKAQREVQKMVAGPNVFICDECVAICVSVMGADPKWRDEQIAELMRLRADPNSQI